MKTKSGMIMVELNDILLASAYTSYQHFMKMNGNKQSLIIIFVGLLSSQRMCGEVWCSKAAGVGCISRQMSFDNGAYGKLLGNVRC